MLTTEPQQRIFIATQPLDFRKGMDSIIAYCRSQFQQNPQSGHFFIFCNRKKTSIKILVFDRKGYWLCQNRLSQGKFKHWPASRSPINEATTDSMRELIDSLHD